MSPTAESPLLAAGPLPELRSLADQIFARVKAMILSGRLRPGARIPEEAIAAELGVSRTPIREALRQLQEYGIVRKIPRSFTIVADITDQEADDVVAVRVPLESLSVRLLAARATKEDATALRAIAAACRACLEQGNVAGVFEHDSRLHLEIARRTGNRPLLDLMERLDARVQMARLKRCVDEKTIAKDLRTHGPIIDAIERHDVARAASLMESHVLKGGATKGA